MTVLLRWLVEQAWLFYVLCAGGVIFYVVRALRAHRDRNLALFTLERETATSRAVRAWAMAVVIVTMGVTVFLILTAVLPGLPFYESGDRLATPTSVAGVEIPTAGVTPTPSPTVGFVVPTPVPVPTSVVVPPPPLDTPSPAPTNIPAGAIAGELDVRFGDFAALIGYSVPAAEISTAQPLQLTLYWRALEGTSPMDYMVFTHLLSEAEEVHLVAQDDDQPADGTRPITGWVAGETIVDVHPMVFRDTAYVGPARIEVGLYDPSAQGDRVLTSTGADRVVLPVSIRIIPQ